MTIVRRPGHDARGLLQITFLTKEADGTMTRRGTATREAPNSHFFLVSVPPLLHTKCAGLPLATETVLAWIPKVAAFQEGGGA